MSKWMTTAAVLAACGVCFLAGQVSAQEDGGGGMQIPEWAQKGPQHEDMKKWAGEWDVSQKMWMAPGQPPMEMSASNTNTLLWDGRYLTGDFKGNFMGTEFDGKLLMGFDRVDQKYVSIWIDSMSTYVSVSYGTEKDGKIVFETNDPDWVTGEKKKGEITIEWKGEDQYVLTMGGTAPDGSAYTQMEMTYTRKKAAATGDE